MLGFSSFLMGGRLTNCGNSCVVTSVLAGAGGKPSEVKCRDVFLQSVLICAELFSCLNSREGFCYLYLIQNGALRNEAEGRQSFI